MKTEKNTENKKVVKTGEVNKDSYENSYEGNPTQKMTLLFPKPINACEMRLGIQC